MHVTLLNGCESGNPTVEIIINQLKSLAYLANAEIARFDLAGMKINPCRGDFACWLATPGICSQPDDTEKIFPEMVKSELYILISPVVFGGFGYHLKKAYDRMIPVALPFLATYKGETHHYDRYDTKATMWIIGIQPTRALEEELLFKRLAERNALNMHDPHYRVCVVAEDEGKATIEGHIQIMGGGNG